MRHVRRNLTLMKNQMKTHLPEDEVLFDSPGINKTVLNEAIDNIHSLLGEIRTNGQLSEFEVANFKLRANVLYGLLKQFLEEEMNGKEVKLKFKVFLDNLDTLIKLIQHLHIISSKEGLKYDRELADLKTASATLIKNQQDVIEKKEELQESVAVVNEQLEYIKTSGETVNSIVEELKTWREGSNGHYEKITEIHGKIDGWDADVQVKHSQYESLSNKADEICGEIVKSQETINGDLAQAAECKEKFFELESQNKNLLNEIEETLADANRVGMAASFKERKRELRWQHGIWQVVFILTTIAITVLSFRYILPVVTAPSLNWLEIFGKSAAIAPLVWLGWFAAKQHGYVSRIREDYAFKFAAAMSYEGHKKAAREIDADLEKLLLEFSLYNMAQNPIRLYGKRSDYATPIHELADTILGKIPRFKRVAASAPGVGEVNAELDAPVSVE